MSYYPEDGEDGVTALSEARYADGGTDPTSYLQKDPDFKSRGKSLLADRGPSQNSLVELFNANRPPYGGNSQIDFNAPAFLSHDAVGDARPFLTPIAWNIPRAILDAVLHDNDRWPTRWQKLRVLEKVFNQRCEAMYSTISYDPAWQYMTTNANYTSAKRQELHLAPLREWKVPYLGQEAATNGMYSMWVFTDHRVEERKRDTLLNSNMGVFGVVPFQSMDEKYPLAEDDTKFLISIAQEGAVEPKQHAELLRFAKRVIMQRPQIQIWETYETAAIVKPAVQPF